MNSQGLVNFILKLLLHIFQVSEVLDQINPKRDIFLQKFSSSVVGCYI